MAKAVFTSRTAVGSHAGDAPDVAHVVRLGLGKTQTSTCHEKVQVEEGEECDAGLSTTSCQIPETSVFIQSFNHTMVHIWCSLPSHYIYGITITFKRDIDLKATMLRNTQSVFLCFPPRENPERLKSSAFGFGDANKRPEIHRACESRRRSTRQILNQRKTAVYTNTCSKQVTLGRRLFFMWRLTSTGVFSDKVLLNAGL